MRKRWRRWAICASIAAGSVAGARLLSTFRFFELLNLKSLDAQFVVRGRLPPSNIMLVLADQKALDTFPELRMFWHHLVLGNAICDHVRSMRRSVNQRRAGCRTELRVDMAEHVCLQCRVESEPTASVDMRRGRS